MKCIPNKLMKYRIRSFENLWTTFIHSLRSFKERSLQKSSTKKSPSKTNNP